MRLKATSAVFAAKLVVTGMVLISIMSVSACGKKPSNVDPPTGKENVSFPSTYPSPDSVK